MTVDRAKTPHRSEYKGWTVYFCSAGCKASFDAAPERYVDPAGREVAALEHAGDAPGS
jgi:Cu+-exporting ATPase